MSDLRSRMETPFYSEREQPTLEALQTHGCDQAEEQMDEEGDHE